MEAYAGELEKAAALFDSIPRRFSEETVRRVGARSHFEFFEDDIPGGRRLSLSGSIVVVDIDFIDGKISDVNISLASEPTVDPAHSFMAPINNCKDCLFKSLHRHRMDLFSSILQFLARCDRYSTKAVDCFQTLDKVTESIMTFVAKQAEPSSVDGPFGIPHINPNQLGLGLLYYQQGDQKCWAFLDIQPGTRSKYAARYMDSWINKETGEWLDIPEPSEDDNVADDTRAELVLQLDPPIITCQQVTRMSDAELETADSVTDMFNQRALYSSFTVPRHPALRGSQDSDYLDVSIINGVPYEEARISRIPISHPRQIPAVLAHLRRACVMDALVLSMLRGRQIIQDDGSDLSIADALELQGKPVQHKSVRVTVIPNIPAHSPLEAGLRVYIPQIPAKMSITFKTLSSKTDVEIDKPVNLHDLQKLVDAHDLALAVSYILGSLNVRHARTSMSITTQ